MSVHFIIPDTQAKPGVPLDHLGWIGAYIVERQPDVVVHLGDHWDFPSLSSYDRGKKAMEGRRVEDDIEAGNEGMRLLTAGINNLNATRERPTRRRTRRPQPGAYEPRLVLLRGNHEHRLQRAIEDDARMDGVLTFDDLESPGWEVHDFLEVVKIDGVHYSHYFYNPMTGRPYAGQNVDTRLKTIGHSFTMGHQQGLKYGLRETIGGIQHGLIAGSCYLHDEDYLGPQSNTYWRGLVVCHQVEDGSYDPMFVSLDYLCRRYEGIDLKAFLAKQ